MSKSEKIKKLLVFSDKIVSSVSWDIEPKPRKKADSLEELFIPKASKRFSAIKRDIYETYLENRRGCIITGRRIGYSASILILSLFEAFSQPNQKTTILTINIHEARRLFRIALDMLSSTFSEKFCQESFSIHNESKIIFLNGSIINFLGGYREDLFYGSPVNNLFIDCFSQFPESVQSDIYNWISIEDTRKAQQKVLLGSPPAEKFVYREVTVPSVVYDKNGNEFHLPRNTVGYKQVYSTFYTITKDPLFKNIVIPSHDEESFRFMDSAKYAAEFQCKFIENKLRESNRFGENR